MKYLTKAAVLVSCALIFCSSFLYSQPAPHAHASRTHVHPLPKQGIKHRHGSGQYGALPSSASASSSIKQPIPHFFGGNKCKALAAWVKPLQTEFPNVRFGSENEISIKPMYKLLFSDSYFVPTFGRPVDTLNGQQRTAIGRALNFAMRNCKGINTADVKFLTSIHPWSSLSRPFNRGLKLTTFSYTFVVDHAQKRRKALAPSGVIIGRKPTTEQLIKTANSKPSIYQLLWPSERLEITISKKARQLNSNLNGKLAPAQPFGRWFGLALCGKRYREGWFVDIQRYQGKMAGVIVKPYRAEFELIPSGKATYNLRSTSSSIGGKASITTAPGQPELLTMQIHSGCKRIVAARFQAISGLRGKYAKASDQKAFCSDVVESWLYSAQDKLSIATKLKEDLYPLLKNYDVQKAAGIAMFADSVIKDYFGLSRKQMNSKQLNALKSQVSACALLNSPNRSDIRMYKPLFSQQSIYKVRKQVMHDSKKQVASLQLTKPFDQFISGQGKVLPSSSLSALFLGWDTLIKNQSSLSTLESFIRDRASRLTQFDPREVKRTLIPISEQLRSARLAGHSKNNASKMNKYQKLLKSANIPYKKIDAPYRQILQSMANAQPVHFDASTMMFFGGLSSYFGEHCKNSLSIGERTRVAQFIVSSTQRAAMGNNYSNKNVGESMRQQIAGQTILVTGLQSAKIMRCGAATPMLTLVADMVESNETNDEGGEPLFIRSCAPVHGSSKCKCLAKTGMAVFPDINHRRYSSRTIRQIIKRNPLIGLQIGMGCGISRY